MHLQEIVLRIDSLKLNIFEGLIANNVRCYRKKEIGKPIFEADAVQLHLSPIAWISGKSAITAAGIRNGRLQLLRLSPKKAVNYGINAFQRLLVAKTLSADLSFHQWPLVEVADFSMSCLGINISGSGSIMIPLKPESDIFPVRKQTLIPLTYLDELQNTLLRLLAISGRKTTVNAQTKFFFDPSDMDRLKVQAKIIARHTDTRESPSGSWSAMVNIKGKSGDANLKMNNYCLNSVWVDNAYGSLRFNEKSVCLEKLEAIIGRERQSGPFELSLACNLENGHYKGHFLSGFDPHFILPLFGFTNGLDRSSIEDCKFDAEPPTCSAAFSGSIAKPLYFQAKGMASVKHFRYHGVSNLSAKTVFSFEHSVTNNTLALTPLSIVREDGFLQGDMKVDLLAKTLDFNAFSTTDPKAVIRILNPVLEPMVEPFQVKGPVIMFGSGIINYSDDDKTDAEYLIDSRNLGLGNLLSSRCLMDIHVLGEVVDLSTVQLEIYGGTVEGSALFCPIVGQTNDRYLVQAEVNDIDFQMLVDALTDQKSTLYLYHGKCSAEGFVEGSLGDTTGETALGNIAVEIVRGQVFQIPLFSPLANMFTKLLPGLGLLFYRTDAKAVWELEDGKLHTDEILIKGDIFSLKGKGDYYFGDGLDFNVQVNLLHKYYLLGNFLEIVTFPLSKGLEFHLGGTLSDPSWRPVYLPKELFLIFE